MADARARTGKNDYSLAGGAETRLCTGNGATAPVRDTPGGKGSTGNKADPYIELGEKIAEKENELAEIYGEIVRALGEMRDNELQTLLLERYVNGATWAQAARRLHYSEAHVKGYMHRMALNAVDKLIPHNTQ